MAGVIPNEGEVEFLTRALKYEGSKLKLFTNNFTPSGTTTVGSAIECSTGGYSGASLSTSWTISTLAGGTSQAAFAEQTFTFTSGCTAYGYLVTNSAASVVIVAEAFTDGPYVIPSGGGTIKVTPIIDGKSLN